MCCGCRRLGVLVGCGCGVAKNGAVSNHCRITECALRRKRRPLAILCQSATGGVSEGKSMPTKYISSEPLHPEQWVSLLFVLLAAML